MLKFARDLVQDFNLQRDESDVSFATMKMIRT